MSAERSKEAAGRAAARLLKDGMRLGLGTGSTAHFFIVAVGEAVRSGLQLQAVATSQASAHLAEELGIQLVELDRRGLDLAVDGADQIDPQSRLIKGGGGAHVRERLVAVAARRFVVVADAGKMVDQLSPAWAPSRTRNSKRMRSSCCGTPHSRSWYWIIRGVVAHGQRRIGVEVLVELIRMRF